MNQKKVRIAFIACVLLFTAALVLSAVFSQEDALGFSGTGGGHVVISEILASNRTCPAPNGQYLDYIEVRNLSKQPADISGYMLSDSPDSIGYTFPQGSVIPAGGYTVVWCDKACTTGEYAAFGISKDGGETISLYNGSNVVVDEKEVTRTDANISLVRLDDGTWTTSRQPTPGYENSEAGYSEWLEAMGAGSTSVIISEVMTGSSCLAVDDTDRISDWVELWNTGDTAVSLGGAYLSDDPADSTKWQIPALELAPGERKIICCAGDGAEKGQADFALSRDGCTVTLTGILGNAISTVTVPQLGRDISWSLQPDGTYQACAEATPGYENTADGYAAWLSAMDVSDIRVVISEVMPSNNSTVLNAAGNLCDWVELQNMGELPAVLDGGYLSNDTGDRGKWKIPSLTLNPGERAVICCSGLEAVEGEANFSLSRDGCTVVLSGCAGNVIDQVEVPALAEDRAWALQEDGSFLSTVLATPGFENTEAGRLQYNATRSPAGALAISEVMPSNNTYYRQGDGKYYDWVELVNISGESIDLSAYCLSNDPDNRELFRLPQQTLKPGERVQVMCIGNVELDGYYIFAPFTLSREESWLYVTGPDGTYSDYMRIYDVPYQGSVGRVDGDNATYYFTNPTPGAKNGAGVAFISATPTALTEDGVYNDVERVVVELAGKGDIRYTLDGSMPTSASRLYTEALVLTQTTAIRFASFEEGKLRSDVVTVSYIINENHTLPVISLAMEPADFSLIYTNYTWDREVRGNISLYEDTGSFNIDCGVKMYGHTGLEMPKKSFKVNFRGRYGEDVLDYQVFGEGSAEIYDSLCIRAGQDYARTIFREQLFTSLCADATDKVLIQKDKFCILYINGRYYGIYCLKEAFTELYYAQNMGVSEESVTITQAPVSTDTEMFQIIRYCRTHDMTQDEHYQYVADRIDIDSLVDWMVMEAYSSNGDVQQNLRYFKSTENGNKYMLAFYDLDWAFYYENGFRHVLDPEKEWQHLGLTFHLAKNAAFRQKLLERTSYHMYNTLTDEIVLAKIQYYADLLEPEIVRERSRWEGSWDTWQYRLTEMREYLTTKDHWAKMLESLDYYLDLTDEEWSTYFGR